MNHDMLVLALKCFAVIQLVVAIINLQLVVLLQWREELLRQSLLLRQVFHVHKVFVTITLIIFAVLTWRFADHMAGGDELARWLAGAIGVFWLIRTGVQVFYYSPSHWRGQRFRIAIHIVLLIVYGAMSATYLLAAFESHM